MSAKVPEALVRKVDAIQLRVVGPERWALREMGYTINGPLHQAARPTDITSMPSARAMLT
jgi:hypothetical protein